MTTRKQREREESLENLRKSIKPGDTINCILRSVSRSGMSRVISFYRIDHHGAAQCLDWHMSRILDLRQAPREGLKVSGCGSDMGFECVYSLGRAMFPEGFGIKSAGGIRPRSKEHAAQLVAEGKTEFRGRNGDKSGWDDDGGYALRAVWL